MLKALVDRIIPADDFPAASEAGVVTYLDQLIGLRLPERSAEIAVGLDAIDSVAEETYNASFAVLPVEDQDSLISELLSRGSLANRNLSEFLSSMINYASEGYYANPENGGNVNSVSWKMIGFEVVEGVRLVTHSVEKS